MLNLTRRIISKWETGKSLPDIDNLVLLSDIYKISLDQLIGRETVLENTVVIKNKNKQKDFFRMITKQTAITMSMVSIILLLFIGRGALKQYEQSNVDKKDGFVTLYGVEEAEYTNMSDPNSSIGGLVSLTLYSGEVIKPVSWQEIKTRGLNKKSKIGISDGFSDINYDGIVVGVSSLKDYPY